MAVNQTIGSFEDKLKNRVFYFVWNEYAYHGIYMFDAATENITPLLISGTNTKGDVLNFNLQVSISDACIIYGDATQGDVLYFLDSLRRPSKINIDRALANGYGLMERNFLEVIKAPPVMPPQVVYENDNNVTANNLKTSLFQFATVYEYWDKEKSVVSTGSIVPLPDNSFDMATDGNQKNNSRIAVYVETGSADVQRIQILMRQTQNTATSGWLKVITLDKDDLGIQDNDVYRFVFYNDGVYTPVDIKYTSLLFDRVPIQAYSQAALNGVIPSYSGIVEGYNPINALINYKVSSNYLPYNIYNGVLFFAYQKDERTFSVYLTGTGANDINNNPQTLRNTPNVFYVTAQDVLGADKGFSYTNSSGSNITDILNGIKISALAKGFAVVSQTSNSVVLNSAIPFNLFSSYLRSTAGYVAKTNEAQFAFAPLAAYSFAVQYFDAGGRTIGAQTNIKTGFTTPDYINAADNTIKLPVITLSIYHRPPPEAVSWSLLRTNQSTFGKRFNWVSGSAYSDYNITAGVSQQFAYIGIGNIAEFNKSNNTDNPTIGYEFQLGDRIKFISRVDTDGSRHNLFGKDYTILGVVQNPYIGGIAKTGTFVKIAYPTPDIGTDFKFDGTAGFQNYQILLYNLVQHTEGENVVYFEFGKKYGIGNAGTNNAYHFADTVQSADLSTPAQVVLTEGDQIFRYRSVPTGITNDIPSPPCHAEDRYRTIPFSLSSDIIVTGQYSIKNQTFTVAGIGGSDYPNSSNDVGYKNLSSLTQTLEISGDINVAAHSITAFNPLIKIVSPANVITIVNALQPYAFDATDSQYVNKDFHFDVLLQIPTGYHAFFLVQNDTSNAGSTIDDLYYTVTNLQYKIISNISIPIVEDTFSDTYAIRTNSNSRPSVVQPDARQTFYPEMTRYGLAYEPDTNINQSNRFYEQNYVLADRSKGIVERMVIKERRLYVYQQRAVGWYGVYSRILKDNNGQNVEVSADEILSRDSIQYLQGDYGVNDDAASVIQTTDAEVFVDSFLGEIVARYGNGLDPLSQKHYGQYFIRSLILPYAKGLYRVDGSRARIFGAYDYMNEEWIFVLQGSVAIEKENELEFSQQVNDDSTNIFFAGLPIQGWIVRNIITDDNDNTQTVDYRIGKNENLKTVLNGIASLINNAGLVLTATVDDNILAVEGTNIVVLTSMFYEPYNEEGYTFTFNRKQNGFSAFFNYHPECISSIGEKIISWNQGVLKVHDSPIKNTFSGVTFDSTITLVFKQSEYQDKTWKSVMQVSNVIWDCPEIITQLDAYGIGLQESNLVIKDFRKLSGKISASFKRDIKSRGGRTNGIQLKGNYIKITFRAKQPTGLVFLSLTGVEYQDSPLNVK